MLQNGSTTLLTRLSATLALLSVSGNTLSHEDYITEIDLLDDIPVVSAVSGFEQALDQAPASVTIIDRDLIEMSGAQTFVDIFRLVPGFQAYYVSANRYGIGYHDIGKESPNQVEVMVDGRFVYDALFSSVNWGTLGVEISDIDYIEIVRGSNAAAQGSNAFRNSINIVTRKPVQDTGTEIRATIGDLNTRNGSIRFSNRLGALDYRLTLGYQKNDGFPAVPEGPLDDGREMTHTNMRGTYTPTLIDTFDIAFGFAKDRVGWGDADHPDEFSLARSYSHFESIKWVRSTDNRNEFSVHFYHNKFRTVNDADIGTFADWLDLDPGDADFITQLAATSPNAAITLARDTFPDETLRLSDDSILTLLDNLDTGLEGGLGRLASERFDLQFQHRFRVSDRLRGAWGAGARDEKISRFREQTFDIQVDEQYFRLFGHAEWWATHQMVFNTGAMVEDTFVGTLISPRVAVNYLLNDNHMVRLAYTEGHRAPSLLEANERNIGKVAGIAYDLFRVGDPDLKEERVDTAEFGYLLKLPRYRFTMDVRVFHEHVRDIIDEQVIPVPEGIQTLDDNLKIITNGGFWQINGAEIQLTYNISPETLVRFHYMNVDLDRHTLYRLDTPRGMTRAYIKKKQDRMAKHSGGLLINHRFNEQWSASLIGYYQSDVTWEDGNSIDGFLRTDAQLAYDFTVGQHTGRIRLIGQNLGGDYEEFIDNNRFQTRVFVSAELDLP